MSFLCFGSFRQSKRKEKELQSSGVFFPEELVTINRSLVSADFVYLPLDVGFRHKTEHLRRKDSMTITRNSASSTTNLPSKHTPTQQGLISSAVASDIQTNLERHGSASSESKDVNASADSIDSGALTSSSSSLSCFHHLEATRGRHHHSNAVGLICPLLEHSPGLHRLYPRLQEQQQQQQQQ